MEMDIIFRYRGLYFARTNLNSGQGHVLSLGGTWKTENVSIQRIYIKNQLRGQQETMFTI